jgi:hypothetical protein
LGLHHVMHWQTWVLLLDYPASADHSPLSQR